MKAVNYALVLLSVTINVVSGETILSTPDTLMVHHGSLRNIGHFSTNKDSIQFFGDTNVLVLRVCNGVVFADLDLLRTNRSPQVIEAEDNVSKGYDFWWSPVLKRLDQLTMIEPRAGIVDMAVFPEKHLLATAGFVSSKNDYYERTVKLNFSTLNNIALYKVFPEKRRFSQVASVSIGGQSVFAGRVVYEIPSSINFNCNGNKLVVATQSNSYKMWPCYRYFLPNTNNYNKSQNYIFTINATDGDYSMKKPLPPLEAEHSRVRLSFFSQKAAENRLVTSFTDGLIGFLDIRNKRWRKRNYLAFNETSGAIENRRRASRFAPNPHLNKVNSATSLLLYVKETASANYLIVYPDSRNAYTRSVNVLMMRPFFQSALFNIAIENRALNPNNCHEIGDCDWFDRNNGRPFTIATHPSEEHDWLLYSPSYRTERDSDSIPPVEFTIYDLKVSEPDKPVVIANGSIRHLYRNPFHSLHSYCKRNAGSEFHPTKKLVASTVGSNHIVLWTWDDDTQSIEIVAKIISKNLRGCPYQEIKFNPLGDLLVSTSAYATDPAGDALVTEVWDVSGYLETVPDITD